MISKPSALVLALSMLMSLAPAHASADEIPHENYELVESNLNVVIAILNSSIDYSELALMSMYNQSMDSVERNLSIVRGILDPAERLLSEIRDIASSYSSLSALLPPFAALSSQEDSFALMEATLLADRTRIVSASMLENLTGEQRLDALSAIASAKALIVQMNDTIDDMLASAYAIGDLEVDGKQPFQENSLVPLILRLRDLLVLIEIEIEELIHGGVPWNDLEPFLILWVSSPRYHLGDEIRGGGYLFFNGTFPSGHLVRIMMDGANLTASTTRYNGEYLFSYQIPIEASWLGTHQIQATASTPVGQLFSETITITVSLIPTRISIEASKKQMSIEESVSIIVRLKDESGAPIEKAPCHFTLDGADIDFTTGSSGEYVRVWPGSVLGYGTHSFQATYEGELPYAPSISSTANVVVDISTSVDLNLFETRYLIGFYVVGNGTLTANGTTPLEGRIITLSVDGVAVANITTDARGSFSYSIPTQGMLPGSHTLKAALLHKDDIWRYSEDQETFTVYTRKKGSYPFFPFIPGWGDLFPSSTFPDLFFGKYAYFFWMLVLTFIGVAVKVYQIRKRPRGGETPTIGLEPLDKALAEGASAADGTAEDFALDLPLKEYSPGSPNENIIVYYHKLLAFLSRKRGVGIRDNMTHWEVAGLLKSLGYPLREVDTTTILFERALYSGTTMSESDTVNMSVNLGRLVGLRSREAGHAE